MEELRKKDLLEVNDLKVEFPTRRGVVSAVNGISYHVAPGEIVGIVGESGSGKSVEAMSVMRLLKKPGKITGGTVLLDGEDILQLSPKQMEHIRGSKISMVFQDPLSCLDPVFTIGYQLAETIKAHESVSSEETKRRSIEALRSVGIADAERILTQYPHELSGGMRQRVMIAIAMLCEPKLLIADEPTTALDVTIQTQILEIIKKMRNEKNMSIVFITHNFGVIADICDRVYVMYGGMIMEEGAVNDLFYSPAHPYTSGLLKAIPSLDGNKDERLIPIPGTPINPMNIPKGCVFSERCQYCMDRCREKRPEKTDLGNGHSASCWLLNN